MQVNNALETRRAHDKSTVQCPKISIVNGVIRVELVSVPTCSILLSRAHIAHKWRLTFHQSTSWSGWQFLRLIHLPLEKGSLSKKSPTEAESYSVSYLVLFPFTLLGAGIQMEGGGEAESATHLSREPWSDFDGENPFNTPQQGISI